MRKVQIIKKSSTEKLFNSFNFYSWFAVEPKFVFSGTIYQPLHSLMTTEKLFNSFNFYSWFAVEPKFVFSGGSYYKTV